MAYQKSEKIYVGTGYVAELEWGKIVKLGISEEGLDKMKEHLSDGWVNLDVVPKKEPKNDKNTMSVSINTWKPDKDKGSAKSPEDKPQRASDNLPF